MISIIWRGEEVRLQSAGGTGYRLPFAEATRSMLWAPIDSVALVEPRWMADAFWFGLTRALEFYGDTAQEAIDQLEQALAARAAVDAAYGIVCDQCGLAIADLDRGALTWSTNAERMVTRFNVVHVSCNGPDYEFELELRTALLDHHRLLTEVSWPDDLKLSLVTALGLERVDGS